MLPLTFLWLVSLHCVWSLRWSQAPTSTRNPNHVARWRDQALYSTFVKGLDAQVEREKKAELEIQLGENGMPEYTIEGVQDPRCALFFSLVRGLTENRVESMMMEIKKLSDSKVEDPLLVHDLFVMAMQTRDLRGGKGDRELFYVILLVLYKIYPETTLKMLPLIPEYGYFKDYLRLLEIIIPNAIKEKQGITYHPEHPYQRGTFYYDVNVKIDNEEQRDRFMRTAMGILAAQLRKDEAIAIDFLAKQKANETNSALDFNREYVYFADENLSAAEKLTSAAKWAPRKSRHFARGEMNTSFKYLQELLFPKNHVEKRNEKYRRMLKSITQVMDIVEQKMCRGQFADINFKRVPSRAMYLYQKAFLNEDLDAYFNQYDPDLYETGNRHPNDPDRVQARKNLQKSIGKNEVKAGTLFPYEIVAELLSTRRRRTRSELDLIEAQWNSIRQTLATQHEEEHARLAELAVSKEEKGSTPAAVKKPLSLGKIIPMADVSGSMSGIPMECAISLSILLSEFNAPAFKDRVMTFSGDCDWCDLSAAKTLAEKVKKLHGANWGMNTNIEAAFKRIIDVIRENKLPADEVPDLIIFSDMQFDEATADPTIARNRLYSLYTPLKNKPANDNRKATQMENIRKYFHDVGMEISGQPYPIPRIIFWNLRGDTTGYPATADDDNVMMLSGFSPSLFKFILQVMLCMFYSLHSILSRFVTIVCSG